MQNESSGKSTIVRTVFEFAEVMVQNSTQAIGTFRVAILQRVNISSFTRSIVCDIEGNDLQSTTM